MLVVISKIKLSPQNVKFIANRIHFDLMENYYSKYNKITTSKNADFTTLFITCYFYQTLILSLLEIRLI